MSVVYKEVGRLEGVRREVAGGLQLPVVTGSRAVCSLVNRNSHSRPIPYHKSRWR